MFKTATFTRTVRRYAPVIKLKYLIVLSISALAIAAITHGIRSIRLAMLKDEIRIFLDTRKDMRSFHVSTGYASPDSYIAHGGGVGDFVYTNSIEAIADSLSKGFKYIELDMLVTSDKRIIGGHSWADLKKYAGMDKCNSKPLSYAEVKNLKIKGKYSILDAVELARIMRENTDFILVVDKIKEYQLLMQQLPFPDRMIVEVSSINDYWKALNAGIKYPAFNVCTPAGIKTAEECGFPIIVINSSYLLDRASASALQRLHNEGVAIFSFNDKDLDTPVFLKNHLGKTISKVYTDFWSPAQMP